MTEELVRLIAASTLMFIIGYAFGCERCKTKREEMWDGVDRIHKG